MSTLPGGTLRRRKANIREIVTNLDAFTKTKQDVTEAKSTSGGIISTVCFIIIGILTLGELNNFFFGDAEYEYKFAVDTAFNEEPFVELDMIVATPCNSLSIQLSDAFPQLDLINEFKKDPTRFEFTEKELIYWNQLKKAHGLANSGATVFKGLEKMTFVSGGVEEGLAAVAEQKQKEEAHAIEQDRLKNPEEHESHGHAIFLIGSNMNGVFQIISSSSGKDEGTACRIHGRVKVSKVKGDNIIISVGKGSGIEVILEHIAGASATGNISHRIERLNFGPRLRGLVTPLAGTEQISPSGRGEYRYFLKIVPTKIYHGLFGGFTTTYQYSVTSTRKNPKDDEHFHSGIVLHYDFAATVIEVHPIYTSGLQLLVRLCSVVGGVFATSSMLHGLFGRACCLWIPRKHELDEKILLSKSVDSLSLPASPLVQDL